MAKTVSFGIPHLGTSFTVRYALTGSVTIAGAVTFIEPLANTVLHYFFGKYWDHPRVGSACLLQARHRQQMQTAGGNVH